MSAWSRRAFLGASVSGAVVGRSAWSEETRDPSWLTDRRLPNEPARVELTRAYLGAHLRPEQVDRVDPEAMTPRAVVLHWTGSASAESAWQTFAPARLKGRPELSGAGALNVSAHFIMDRSGRCWRLLDERRVARHVIGLNHCAIGVENVGDGPLGGSGGASLTSAQVERNAQLVRSLVGRHPSIQWLLGHHEYRRMESTDLFCERDPGYRTTKIDPGDAFMQAVRGAVADLGLRAPPSAATPG